MAAPIPISNGDIVEVRVMQRQASQIIMNTVHYEASITSSGATFVSVVDALDLALKGTNGFLTKLNAMQHITMSQNFIQYQLIYPTRYVVREKPGLGPGARADDSLIPAPPNVAGVTTRRSNFAVKGRTSDLHIGGLIAQDVQGGILAGPTLAGLIQVGIASLVVQALAGGVTLIPVIPPKPAKPPKPALPALELTAYTTQYTSRTMRRRGVGLGI